MSQLKVYSEILDEVLNIGPPSEDLDKILGLTDLISIDWPGMITFVEGPVLQKWVDA